LGGDDIPRSGYSDLIKGGRLSGLRVMGVDPWQSCVYPAQGVPYLYLFIPLGRKGEISHKAIESAISGIIIRGSSVWLKGL
jgi:hypothetical protein